MTPSLPDGWETVRLDSMCAFASGGTPSKAVPEYWRGAIPWASPKDLKRPVLTDTQDHISEAGLAEGSALAPAGAVLVVVRGMILARDVPVARAAVPMAFNQDIKAVIPGDRIDSRFLLHVLRFSKGELARLIGRSAHGTRTLLSEDLASITVPLPPMRDQMAIADALDLVQAGIDVTEQLVETSRELKQATMHHLFTRGLRGEPQQETEVGLVPANWHLATIGSLGDIITGTTPRTARRDYYEGGTIPFISPGDMGRATRITTTQKKLTTAGFSVARQVPADSVCFVCIGSTIGKVGVTSETSATNQQINTIVVDDRHDPTYVAYLVSFYSEYIASHASPSPVPIMSKGVFSRIALPVSDDPDEQQRIGSIIGSIDDKIDLHVRKHAALGELFTSLLHGLMTGRIRISDLHAESS